MKPFFTLIRWLALLVAYVTVLSIVAYLSVMGLSAETMIVPTLQVHDRFNINSTKLPITPEKETGLPSVAYFMGGVKGDLQKMKRLLLAIYHHVNEYLLEFDIDTPVSERQELARFIRSHPVFNQVGNVGMLEPGDQVTYNGPTMVTQTLHSIAVLLRRRKDWDWYINLSASDYPLVTQDEFLAVMSSVPRHLNFLDHSRDTNTGEMQTRISGVVVDPGFYDIDDSPLVNTGRTTRKTPTAFQVLKGSAWFTLSRSFAEYLIWGYDNLPRQALGYFANFRTASEAYFQTVICNSADYRNSTVTLDLHVVKWGRQAGQHPLDLNSAMIKDLISNGSPTDPFVPKGSILPFARKFRQDDPVLDMIDKELLGGRQPGRFVVGGWCADAGKRVASRHSKEGLTVAELASSPSPRRSSKDWTDADPCSIVGDRTVLKTGRGAVMFGELMRIALSNTSFWKSQCPKNETDSASHVAIPSAS